MKSILNKLMLFVGFAMIIVGLAIALVGISGGNAMHVAVGFVILSAGILLSSIA